MPNVLLMLAKSEPPDPKTEIAWHLQNLKKQGTTYFATPQAPRTVGRGEVVVFYGDATISHAVFAVGRFCDLVDIASRRGMEIATQQRSLYAMGRVPSGAKRWVGVDELNTTTYRSLDDLNGIIVSTGQGNGRPLTVQNLPAGEARRCVYFTTTQPLVW